MPFNKLCPAQNQDFYLGYEWGFFAFIGYINLTLQIPLF